MNDAHLAQADWRSRSVMMEHRPLADVRRGDVSTASYQQATVIYALTLIIMRVVGFFVFYSYAQNLNQVTVLGKAQSLLSDAFSHDQTPLLIYALPQCQKSEIEKGGGRGGNNNMET